MTNLIDLKVGDFFRFNNKETLWQIVTMETKEYIPGVRTPKLIRAKRAKKHTRDDSTIIDFTKKWDNLITKVNFCQLCDSSDYVDLEDPHSRVEGDNLIDGVPLCDMHYNDIY